MLHIASKQKRSLSFLLFLMMLLAFCGNNFSAKTAKAAAEIDHVQDLADILTDEEEERLREECISIGDLNEIDIVILTTNSVPENRKLYLEDFYDAHDDVLTDATLLLINMDPDNRGVQIQGYGQCEFSISDDRVEWILDEIVPYLSDGDYFDACTAYIQEVDYYMSIEATSDYVHTEEDNLNYNENYYEDAQLTHADYIIFNLFVSAIIGLISVVIMLIVNAISRAGVTADRNTYMNSSNSRILGHWDRYIRTTTTRRRKPKDNGGNSSSSGFGGGGVSRGGHSHSGGGRSF